MVATERRGKYDRKPNTVAPLLSAISHHFGWEKFCPGLFSSLSASLWKRQMWICASPPPPTSQNSQKFNNWDNLLACLLLCSTFCPYMLPTPHVHSPLLLHHTFPFHHFCTEMEFFFVEVPAGINSSLLRFKFLSGFQPSFIRSTKCYS